jgi:26S proteasome regulatory subunit (ATPase 3-interacting protein)
MVKANKKPTSGKADDERQTVLDYLRKTNRPYSVTDIFNNLHGVVGKTQVQKVLNQLAEAKEVQQKLYGKQSVYVITQDQFETPSSEELENMDQQIEKLNTQISEVKELNNQSKAALNSLNSSLTTEQIHARLAELAAENQGYEERLTVLRSGARKISVEDKQRIDTEYDAAVKIYKSRKRLFNDIFNAITENMESSPKTFRENIGVEEDPEDIMNLLLLS